MEDESGYTVPKRVLDELYRVLEDIAKNTNRGGLSTSLRASADVDNLDQDESEGQHIHKFSLTDLEEILNAIREFEARNLPLNKITPQNFPLPKLSAKLKRLSRQLTSDQPFFLLRGLKASWGGKTGLVTAFAGIASHVGGKRAMTGGDPHVLQHITAMSVPEDGSSDVYCGPPNRKMEIPFHTDHGDIISLFSLSRPARGGTFYLADINKIVGHIKKKRPEWVQTLKENWDIINPNAAEGYDRRPLLFQLSSGKLAISASRARLTGTPTRPRPQNLEPLTIAQRDALNALHAVGRQVAHRIDFRSGDMIFYNNLRMLHARDAYVDGDETENQTKRYLLRLILKDENHADLWELPEPLQPLWREIYDHEPEQEVFSVKEELFSYKMSHG